MANDRAGILVFIAVHHDRRLAVVPQTGGAIELHLISEGRTGHHSFVLSPDEAAGLLHFLVGGETVPLEPGAFDFGDPDCTFGLVRT